MYAILGIAAIACGMLIGWLIDRHHTNGADTNPGSGIPRTADDAGREEEK